MKKGRTLPELDINSTEAIMNDMVVGLSKMQGEGTRGGNIEEKAKLYMKKEKNYQRQNQRLMITPSIAKKK